jgi:hypothetical protein
MKLNSRAIYSSHAVPQYQPSDNPWLRWTGVGDEVFAHIESVGKTKVNIPAHLINDSTAQYLDGQKVDFTRVGDIVEMDIPARYQPMAVISFRKN